MKNFTEETRHKMSEKAKKRCSDPEWLKRQRDRGTKLPKETVEKMYAEGHTQKEIAEARGVTQNVVVNFMRRHGIPARIAAKRNQKGERNSCWKGGRIVSERGYVMIYIPEHERAKNNGYVYEHILVAEKSLGRSLVYNAAGDPWNEVVHHINGIKSDNSPTNLIVLTTKEHTRFHRTKNDDIKKQVLNNGIKLP